MVVEDPGHHAKSCRWRSADFTASTMTGNRSMGSSLRHGSYNSLNPAVMVKAEIW